MHVHLLRVLLFFLVVAWFLFEPGAFPGTGKDDVPPAEHESAEAVRQDLERWAKGETIPEYLPLPETPMPEVAPRPGRLLPHQVVGEVDRFDDRWPLTRLLMKDDFQALDARLDAAAAAGPDEYGRSTLDVALAELEGNDVRGAHLEAWIHTRQDSPWPYLLRARLRWERAYQVRSTHVIPRLPESRIQGFVDEAQRAQQDLQRAIERRDTLPQPWLLLFSILQATGQDGGPQALARAQAAAPRYLRTYTFSMNFALPQWGGSADQLRAIAADARAAHAEEDPRFLWLELEAHRYLRNAPGTRTDPFTDGALLERLRRELEDIERHNPRSTHAFQGLLFLDNSRTGAERRLQRMHRGAELGIPGARSLLAAAYRDGQGVERDVSRAAQLFLDCADQEGDRDCLAEWGHLVREHADLGGPLAAREAYAALAASGASRGMSNMASLAWYGEDDGGQLAPDPEAGYAWALGAAAGGRAWAFHRLGQSYEQGLGVPASLEHARAWYHAGWSRLDDAECKQALERLTADWMGTGRKG